MDLPHRPKVAIVEDDGTMAYLLDEVCRTAGYEVVGRAASASDALEMLREQSPDYLILDFNLDGQRNGLEVLTAAKKQEPGLFSILITAWDINDIASRIGYAQPDRILRKPVMPQLLVELLKSATAARQEMAATEPASIAVRPAAPGTTH